MRRITILTATLVFLALLSIALALPVSAADKKIDLFGSFSLNDSRHSEYRAMQGALIAEFPVTQHFSIGPVAQYDYIRTEVTETIVTPAPPTETEWAETPSPTVTSIKTHGQTTEVWSVGGRAVLHLTPSHNGFYFAGEATVPQKDAEGYVVTPEAGFQFMLGRAIGRVAYRHPFQYQENGTIDLEGDAVTFAFGARF